MSYLHGIQLTPEFYFYLVFGLFNAAYLWTTFVNYRQLKNYQKQKKAPAAIAAISTPAEYEKSRLYGMDKLSFRLKVDLFNQIFSNVFMYCFGLLYLWNLSGQLLEKVLGRGNVGEIWQTVVFFQLNQFMTVIIGLPTDYWSTFHIEQKHGFNKQTLGLWIKDQVKSLVLGAVLGPPIIAAMIATVKWGGDNFYLAVWILMAAIQAIMILIYPTFIQPLFNKFETLPDGELKTAIQGLAKRLSFPLTKIFVMDGSTRSSHSNAYFFGMFKDKRIVLFDTLINQMNTEEICAVLGHELGHWSCSHLPKRLAIVQLHLFILFYLFSKAIKETSLYQAFGFSSTPIFVGFSIFMQIFNPIEMIVGLLMTAQSRSHEFEADRFACGLGYGKLLQEALIKLHAKNAALVPPDHLYSLVHYSHPPLTERLDAIKRYKPKAQ